MSQLPVPYEPKPLVRARVRVPWSLPAAPLADLGALLGVALAAATLAAFVAVIAVNTWK